MVEAQTSRINPFFEAYGVGGLHPYRDALPSRSGMVAQYMPGGIVLHVLLDNCTDADVCAWRAGGRKFGLLPLRGGYVWLLTDAVAVFDAPYCPGIEPPENQALPWEASERGLEARAGITLILADERRVVRALKLVTVSPDFTRRLEAMHARTLASAPASRMAWDAEMERYFRAYPRPQAAFRHATATCRGGD